MPSLTVENYVKEIYRICNEPAGRPASTGSIATALGVLPGTVTSMLKTLSDSQLVSYVPYEGVRLTMAGTALALRMVRRHRLIELFLVQTLGMSWDEVHEEAEHMEHAVSDRLIDLIDDFLGSPDFDPHGDPIPKADGSLEQIRGQSLAACDVGQRFQLTRVMDQSSEFLRYLSETGLSIGKKGRVVRARSESRTVTIAVEGEETTLGSEVAAKILVSSDGSE